jgi:hypothetical protein
MARSLKPKRLNHVSKQEKDKTRGPGTDGRDESILFNSLHDILFFFARNQGSVSCSIPA